MLALLIKFWPYIAGAVAIIAFLGYLKVLHVEIDHYKTEATTAKNELIAYREAAEATQAAWKSENAALTLESKQKSAKLLQQFNAPNPIIKRIQDNVTLRTVVVPPVAVELFNESTRDPTGSSTASAQRSDESTTESTLADTLAVCAENATNQWFNYKQVIAWQEFWDTYSKGLANVNSP